MFANPLREIWRGLHGAGLQRPGGLHQQMIFAACAGRGQHAGENNKIDQVHCFTSPKRIARVSSRPGKFNAPDLPVLLEQQVWIVLHLGPDGTSSTGAARPPWPPGIAGGHRRCRHCGRRVARMPTPPLSGLVIFAGWRRGRQSRCSTSRQRMTALPVRSSRCATMTLPGAL